MGFRGPKKATPFAASRVVENIFEKLGNIYFGKVSIYVRGVGSGRDAAVRALVGRGINIISLEDTTPVPHNGCRPRKARRV
jgi:small subunit ribosomal protein S11